MPTSMGLSTTWGASEWATQLIESLTLASALLRSGASRTVSDSRVVNIPRLKINPAAAWVAELAAIPSDSGDADVLTLVPKKAANVVSLSRESVEDASIDELTAVGDSMVRGVATRVDATAFANAAATATTPAGLLSYALPGSGAGGTVTIDSILDGVGAVGSHGGVADTVFANPTDITALRKLKSSQGVYLLAPDAASLEGQPTTRVGGCALIPSAGLTAGTAIVCEARFVQVCIRRDASVEFSSDAGFSNDSIVARVTMRIDWNIGDPNAFYVIHP